MSILNLFGIEKLSNIKIQESFKKHSPRKEKMSYSREFYRMYHMYRVPIVLNKNNILVDGYTSYLVAKKNNKKYVKITKVN